ncbi:DUF3304 domain-containing protein [Rahnella bruchi]|uniref:DUF3304 domain-containing protein n=1 Tax=Rahnella bruchi TaxID=1510573 RepID=UPI000EA3704D|nr:DUF3304 domain-containing protein [Rahnella bruchi]
MSKISLALPAWAPPLFAAQRLLHSLTKLGLMMLVLLASACSQANSDEYSGANLAGINHTLQGINHFSVNGYGGGLTGNTCCVMLPDKWYPGMQAKIEWETDPEPYAELPPLGTDAYRAAYAKHAANYQQHSVVVDIPQYDHACAFVVHFLVCHQVKVTTSCSGYGQPDYPIKEPLNMKEPATCPK